MELLERYEIERINERHGGHWFEAGSMRFFNSRVAEVGYKATSGRRVYFVSSERFDASTPRRYSVRVMDLETGDVSTVGVFQQYASRGTADRAARNAAEQDE